MNWNVALFILGLGWIIFSWIRANFRAWLWKRRMETSLRVMAIFGLGPIVRDIVDGKFDWVMHEEDIEKAAKRARKQIVETEEEVK